VRNVIVFNDSEEKGIAENVEANHIVVSGVIE
jgi:hypothetical protein